MITTSPEYMVAVQKGTRQSTAVINFGVYDVTAKDDADPSVNTVQPFTNIEQVNNSILLPEFNMGTFEDDYFKLDGSFVLAPDDLNVSDDLGWWSEIQSDITGVFTPLIPTITIDFDDLHESLGVVITFDQKGGSYCSQFDIAWYQGLIPLDYKLITDNTDTVYVVDTPVTNYDKIIIRLIKSDKPYRYARVMEIDYGIQQTYDGDNIISANIIEEVDPSKSLVSINTMSFTVLNTDQSLNPLNPEGIYQFLQKRQPITAFSGLEVSPGIFEFVPLGLFYLSNWKNNTGITATLKATDIIGIMDKTTYYASGYWDNEPITNVLDNVFANAGDIPYKLDPSLLSETVSGYIPIKSHREAIQDIAWVIGAIVTVDREGFVLFTKVQYTTADYDVDFNTILGTPTIAQKELISSVEAKEFEYDLQSSQIVYSSDLSFVGTKELIVPYDEQPAINVTCAVVGSAVIDTQVNSATASILTITGSGSFTLNITGEPYLEKSKIIRVSLPSLPAGEVPQTATIGENKLIAKSGLGVIVAQSLLDYYQKRIKQTFGYFTNPAVQAKDCLSVETMFGETTNAVVEKHNITFAPNLIAKVEVTG